MQINIRISALQMRETRERERERRRDSGNKPAGTKHSLNGLVYVCSEWVETVVLNVHHTVHLNEVHAVRKVTGTAPLYHTSG